MRTELQKEGISGISLLELLVVVVIAGILASIAIPNFSRMVESARVKDAKTTLQMIFQAERIYRLDQSPATYGDLATNLIPQNYLPSITSADWTYGTSAFDATTFLATATRNNVGPPYGGTTITVDQGFDGSTYGGTHPLK